MKKTITILFIALLNHSLFYAQSIRTETIEFTSSQQPEIVVPANERFYQVTVESPYNLTVEEVQAKSKQDFEAEVANFGNVKAESEAKYQEQLAQYDKDVVLAKEKFELESAEFKKLSLLERLALTDQGKKPQLVLPNRPTYYPPSEPVYREPNLNDYLIVDNSILATKIVLNGFERGKDIVDIKIAFDGVNFQDNAGKSYANLPTHLTVFLNGNEDLKKDLFTEFEFISSYPTNNINKNLEEKKLLESIISRVNGMLNQRYGFVGSKKSITLEYVKNNKNIYDDLEKAHIFVTTNLKKLQEDPNSKINQSAIEGMQKGVDAWVGALSKINYKDKKADYNEEIGRHIYFNLMKLYLALNDKETAESYLNQFQENQIHFDLSYDEKQTLGNLEKEIYN